MRDDDGGDPLSGNFPVVDQIAAAPGREAIATILLQAADSILFHAAGELVVACHRAGFPEGETLIMARMTVLLAVRDAHGVLPWRKAQTLEYLRGVFSDFAAGKAPLPEGLLLPEPGLGREG